MRSYEKFPEKLRIVEDTVCEVYGISFEDLRHGSRIPVYAHPRHVVWTIAVDSLDYALNRLKRIYGKDHTTIRHGVLKMRGSEEHLTVLELLTQKYPHVFSGKLVEKHLIKSGKPVNNMCVSNEGKI